MRNTNVPKLIVGRLLVTISEDSKVYDEGKSSLQLAIDHYDQAVGDLTASIVAGLIH